MKVMVFAVLSLFLSGTSVNSCSQALTSETPTIPDQTGFSESKKAKCESEGGNYILAPLAQHYFCEKPFADAGKACQNSDQCEGYCGADQKCLPTVLGCHELYENGQIVTMCAE